jgi:hypothetical protein
MVTAIQTNLEAFLIEDRVLLLALIYEYQRGEESKYYHMISNFSRDINIGAFFERELLLQFHDDYLLYWAKGTSNINGFRSTTIFL